MAGAEDRLQRQGRQQPSGNQSGMAMPARANLEEIRRAIRTLHEPGEVIELRIPKARREGTLSGYFSDHSALAQTITELDGKGSAVYLTLNPVNPALFARAANHVKPWAEFTTADDDILHRRWMLIDCDPTRPSHISSNNLEHNLALEMANKILDYLIDEGCPDSILADSGNGTHILSRIDLDNDEYSAQLIKGVLQSLAYMFNTPQVEVDATVYNAGRICKAYGSVARKGDSLPDRPHRFAQMLSVPDRSRPIPRQILEKIASRTSVLSEKSVA